MVFASGFSWMHLLPGVGDDTLLSGLGVGHHTYILLHAWLACGILVVLALLGRLALNRAQARPGLERYEADEKLGLLSGVEMLTVMLLGLLEGVMSRKDARTFFGLIGSLFCYILVSNLMGVIPGFLPPTDNANTNIGMALTVFLVFNGVGLWRDPIGYVKHLVGPIIWIGWFILVIEIISLCIRPVSLTIRLTGNIYGDHTVFGIMSDLVPFGLPAVFLGMAVFVSVVQAFVFSLLSTIYIGMALPQHDHHD